MSMDSTKQPDNDSKWISVTSFGVSVANELLLNCPAQWPFDSRC